jgi:ribosome-associated translation inhibitor RaiA
LSDKLRGHIERKLEFAVGRLAQRVDRLSVYLDDLNGPKGGADKRCRILADVRPSQRIVAEQVSDDFFTGISGAAEKLGRAVKRRIDRRRVTARTRRTA